MDVAHGRSVFWSGDLQIGVMRLVALTCVVSVIGVGMGGSEYRLLAFVCRVLASGFPGYLQPSFPVQIVYIIPEWQETAFLFQRS